MDPMRGEVWGAHLPHGIGNHPVVVLTVNALGQHLSALTVAVITGTEGPPSTHIQVDCDSGLTGHDVSYVNATDLHSLPKGKLQKQRGRLSPVELAKIEAAVRTCLGL
jgi:mRNA interferase MazF